VRAGITRWPTADLRIHQRWLDETTLRDPFDRKTMSAEQGSLLRLTLSELRTDYESSGVIRYHQILAHFNICFTLDIPSTRWELIELAKNLDVPMTDFFLQNVTEISERITHEFCLSFVQGVGAAQLVRIRERALIDGCFFGERKRRIPRLIMVTDRDGATLIPGTDSVLKLDIVMTAVNLPWRYMTELEDIDPKAVLFRYLRARENDLRKERGLPDVGAGWLSELLLLNTISELLPQHDVIQHGQPRWLGKQHLDVYIPQLRLAFEYQGVQHFQPVERFGAEDGLRATLERDARKRILCQENGVTLVEVRHDAPWSKIDLEQFLRSYLCSKNTP
jgi:hypothetical protein